MSIVRNSRTRLLTAAATITLAALSLTACNDGTGVQDEGASSAASSTASPSAATSSGSGSSSHHDAGRAADGSKQAPDAPAAKGNGKAGTGDSGNSGASAGRAVTCQGSNTKTVAAPLNRPLNHMLLTVTNTGSTTCYLYGYPAVRFSDAQSVPPVIEDSKPQAVVTLAPGERGYASVSLSAGDGSGGNGRTATSLAVLFQNRTGQYVSSAAHPALPAKGVFIDDSLKVTYWQQSLDSALTW